METKPDESEIIKLPYIVLRTEANTNIDGEEAFDGTELYFKLDKSFEIHQEIEDLKRMGLGLGLEMSHIESVVEGGSVSDTIDMNIDAMDLSLSKKAILESCIKLVPKEMVPYVQQLVENNPVDVI